MGLKRTDEFRQDAVRIALTSGLTRKQVADDLGRRDVDAEQMDHGTSRHRRGVERGFGAGSRE